jgi:hypothetical protein
MGTAALTVLAGLCPAGAWAQGSAGAAQAATPPPSVAERAPEALTGLAGRVFGGDSPLAAAEVYVYQLADFRLHRTETGSDGRFDFADLPAGLYKVIAHKGGFVPAVVLLTRARDDAEQFVELELTEQTSETAATEDFWSVRERIPPDVLRAIGRTEAQLARHSSDRGGARGAGTLADEIAELTGPSIATEMQAMTGVHHQAAGDESALAGGHLGVEGTMGDFKVGLTGDFWRLGPDGQDRSSAAQSTDGRSRSFLLTVEDDGARLDLVSKTRSLAAEGELPVEYESHRASYAQNLGERSRARLAGYYTSQSNYYAQGLLAPEDLPRDSRSWGVEGTFDRRQSERTSFQAGFEYRDRTVRDLGTPNLLSATANSSPAYLEDERLDLFGRTGVRVRPAVLVEYGLYTTLRDGSLSLQPQGGVVLQLTDSWQASLLASERLAVEGDASGPADFIPALFQESTACTQGEQSCYKVMLTYNGDPDKNESLTVGAVEREIGETLRLFFDDDFFGHLESLYLVPGDEVPEMVLSASRRIAPQVLTRFETHAGHGGGGTFYATDRERYENSVRYLTTSLDTQFTGTATGVFISFHHLEQQLAPVDRSGARLALAPTTDLELQRLQLMLTQDLNILMDLAADWAVKIDMQLSRGSLLFGQPLDEELRRKILGGFAVRF